MINFKFISFILGLVLSKLALFMYIPALYAFFSRTEGFSDFTKALVITHLLSFIFLSIGRTKKQKLNVRDMFLLTTLVWSITSAAGALPFIFINHINFTDAYFETMSGITTTGSTILSHLDNMAPSILLWRSILQWIGGIGFIVMAVAILPMLNVGGMRLFQTESSDWSQKSSPKTKNVAINILLIYLALTFLCFLAFRLAGMHSFEAINHALTTISTGGYSTTDSSMNAFSDNAQWVATLFMFIGGLPFILLVHCIKKNISILCKDAQVQGYIFVVVLSSSLIALWLIYKLDYPLSDAIRISFFNIVSVITTTGFALDDFTAWGAFPSILFAFILMMGACSGSTSGGMKIFRFQIAFSLLKKQMMQLRHPSGVFIQRYNQQRVSDTIISSVVAFTLTYFLTMVFIAALLGLMGIDPITSITGAVTAVANVGPGMGEVIGPTGNFASLPNAAKWILSVGMLMGRLEILTILVILSPSFWRN